MESDEWWIYHLTSDGWVDGSYKHDFQKTVEVPTPPGTVFSRKYYEKLGHRYSQMQSGYKDLTGINDEIKALLEKYPHPAQFTKKAN